MPSSHLDNTTSSFREWTPRFYKKGDQVWVGSQLYLLNKFSLRSISFYRELALGYWVAVGASSEVISAEVQAGISSSIRIENAGRSKLVPVWISSATPIASGGTSNDAEDFNNGAINNGTLGGTTVTYPGQLNVLMPYGIIAGDSIAKGNPSAASWIENASNVLGLNTSHVDTVGQPAYHLARRLGLPMINMGNGGERLDELVARFARDVMGETVSPSPDALPTQTLNWTSTAANTRGKKPQIVVIFSGVNDIAQDETVEQLIQDFTDLGSLIELYSLNAIVATIGPWRLYTADEEAVAFEVNEWLRTTFLELFPSIQLFDYAELVTLGTSETELNTRAHSPAFPGTSGYLAGWFQDDIHPSDGGYDLLAEALADQCRFPTKITKLVLEMDALVGVQPNYALIDTLTINGEAAAHTREDAGGTSQRYLSIPIDMTQGFGLAGRSNPVWSFVPTASTTLHGTGANVGFNAGGCTVVRPN